MRFRGQNTLNNFSKLCNYYVTLKFQHLTNMKSCLILMLSKIERSEYAFKSIQKNITIKVFVKSAPWN